MDSHSLLGHGMTPVNLIPQLTTDQVPRVGRSFTIGVKSIKHALNGENPDYSGKFKKAGLDEREANDYTDDLHFG